MSPPTASPPPLRPGQRGERRAIFSWCLYDFGNSAFTTLIVTFVYAAFFAKRFAANEDLGTALWSRGVVTTALVVAALSPILGAVADRGGYRKAFLLVLTLVTIAATSGLYFVLPGETTKALVVFVIANVAFEMGCVFYNAFLPDVAPPGRIGRISGYGWALGYLGGIAALLLARALFIAPEHPFLGFTREADANIRATTLLTAAWFAVFALPLLLWVREDRSRVSPKGTPIVRTAMRQLVATFHEVRQYRQVVRFLLARLLFNDGLITIFAFGGIYAQGVFGFTMDKLVTFGVVLNVTAGAGAFVLGFLDDILGGKKTILITLAALVVSTSVALLARDETLFWIAAATLGIFVGPNQAASRSLMGRFVPPDKENEFFGFFAFSGKATAFMGPFLLGLLTSHFGQRVGFATVILFFLAGGAILWTVDEAEGRRAAGRE